MRLIKSNRMRRSSRTLACVLLVTALCSSGCQNRPQRIRQVSMNPTRAGRQAMEQYDTDGDGFVAGTELEQAPGLRAALETLDRDGDGKVSAEEVADRVRVWKEQQVGLTTIPCTVHMDGRPLVGATVTFEPENFLGDRIETAVGTVSRSGNVSPKIPKQQRPTPDTPPGLRLGLYKVKISRLDQGKEIVPARYNTDTILGQQVSLDDPRIINRAVMFDLQSDSSGVGLDEMRDRMRHRIRDRTRDRIRDRVRGAVN